MKVQTDHLISKMITIIIEHFNFQMIAILFTLSESLHFKKRDIERKLIFFEEIMSSSLFTVFVFLMKNLFLTDLLAFYFLILSIILMIQFSASLKVLFSDSSESAFSVFLFVINLLMSVLLIFLLADTSMCF